MKNTKTQHWFKKLIFLITLSVLFCMIGCVEEENFFDDSGIDNNKDTSFADTGDSEALEGFTCVECHLDKALLIADLEADPLPELDEAPENEGEG